MIASNDSMYSTSMGLPDHLAAAVPIICRLARDHARPPSHMEELTLRGGAQAAPFALRVPFALKPDSTVCRDNVTRFTAM